MRTFSALEAKEHFGQLLNIAQREPITVTKRGQPAAVMMSIENYERMCGALRRRLLETIDKVRRGAASKGLDEDALKQLLEDQS